jgi:hypothetical protein
MQEINNLHTNILPIISFGYVVPIMIILFVYLWLDEDKETKELKNYFPKILFYVLIPYYFYTVMFKALCFLIVPDLLNYNASIMSFLISFSLDIYVLYFFILYKLGELDKDNNKHIMLKSLKNVLRYKGEEDWKFNIDNSKVKEIY